MSGLDAVILNKITQLQNTGDGALTFTPTEWSKSLRVGSFNSSSPINIVPPTGKAIRLTSLIPNAGIMVNTIVSGSIQGELINGTLTSSIAESGQYFIGSPPTNIISASGQINHIQFLPGEAVNITTGGSSVTWVSYQEGDLS